MPKGNRETKKPKQDKPKPAAASPFAAQGRGAPPASAPCKKK
jgi:hypothetical protein